jgi:hypothetical protein
MAIFVVTANWTDQGVRAIKGAFADRIQDDSGLRIV